MFFQATFYNYINHIINISIKGRQIMSPKLFDKKNRIERLPPTPLTPAKFFNTCLLILEKEKSANEDKTQKNILINMRKALSDFKQNHETKPATLDDWKKLENAMEKYISDINKPNKECAERLQLLMQTPLQRMK